MSQVRLLIGTRKGAFVLTSDGKRENWQVSGPHFAGWEIYHMKASPAEPNRLYASQTTGGRTSWRALPGLRQPKGHLWQPRAGGMAVHTIILDPRNPSRIYVAISAAGAFRTDDGGKNWKPINRGLKSNYELPDPDAEVGHCVHRIAIHRSRPGVLFMQKHWDVMRSDNAGDLWTEVSGNWPSDFGFPVEVHA